MKSSLLAVASGLSLISLSPAAFAGGCGQGGPAENCQPRVVVNSGVAPTYGPMTVNIEQPMGYLRSIQFNRAPNVSITRVHSLGPTAALEDAPSGFTDGCHPTSTHYCRGGAVNHAPAPQPVQRPAPQPYIAPPMPAPVVVQQHHIQPAPVYVQQHYAAPAPRTVYVGGGYDESKFIPRQYGDNTFTPGIAHVPTSYVDRSLSQNRTYSAEEFHHHKMTAPTAPGIAPLVMPSQGMGGVGYDNAVTLPGTHIGGQGYSAILPGTHIEGQSYSAILPGTHVGGTSYSAILPGTHVGGTAYSAILPGTHVGGQTYSAAPAPRYAPQMPQPMIVGGVSAAPRNSGPVQTTSGLYASPVDPDGTYWEKTSGVTMFGDTIATQVICRRQLPTQTVHPVVGVPTPVTTCEPVAHADHGPHMAGGPQGHHNNTNDRWVR